MAGHYQTTVEDIVTGRPVNGATILVYEDGASISEDGRSVTTGTLATIYSDDGVTLIDQTNSPLTTGADGEFDFYTNETRVVVAVLYNGVGKIVWNDQDILGGTVSSDVTAIANRLDNLDALLGYPANTTNTGTFTGSIISDSTDLQNALQELETAVDSAVASTWGHASTEEVTGATYTLVLADGDNKYLRVTDVSGCAITVPPNSSVEFTIDTVITFRAATAGTVSLVAGPGVTLNPPGGSGGSLGFAEEGAVVQIKKVATDEWDVIGGTA